MVFLSREARAERIANIKDIIAKRKSVSFVARELSVTRQTVHKWVVEYKKHRKEALLFIKEKSARVASNKTDLDTEKLVLDYAKKNKNDGVVVLALKIRLEKGKRIHPTTIYRILKRTGARYN